MHVLADAADLVPGGAWGFWTSFVMAVGAIVLSLLDRMRRRTRDGADADGLEQIERYIVAPLRAELDRTKERVGELEDELERVRNQLAASEQNLRAALNRGGSV